MVEKRKLLVNLEYDSDADNPVEAAGWKLVSFNTRHAAYEHPSKYFDGICDGKPVGMEQGLRNRFRSGTAFLLGYFEHSLCQWALSGEQHQCPWDSVNYAGLLIFEGKAQDIGKTREDRVKYARSLLQEYTDWCNGQVFFYWVETEDGEILDSCGGVYGSDEMIKEIRSEYKDDELEFVGEASDLACYA